MTAWQGVAKFAGTSGLSAAPRQILAAVANFAGVGTQFVDLGIVGTSRIQSASSQVMLRSAKQREVKSIVNRLLDNLLLTITQQTGETGASLRRQIGDVRANYPDLLRKGTFGTELLECFTLALAANVDLGRLAILRQQLFDETPGSDAATAIVEAAIMFCLSAESQLITAIEFVSRDDVQAMMTKMKAAFDTAREIAADAEDSACYQSLTFLAGALINHLATAARPLPRMVSFKMQATMPTLALSQRIYYVADRSEELISENHIIHPAFAPRDIVGLSA